MIKDILELAFMKIFRTFNSREVTVAASTESKSRNYYKFEQTGPRGLSLHSENFLRSNLMRGALDKEPQRILDSVHASYQISGNPIYLLIAADICRYYSETMPPEERIKYHLGAFRDCYLAFMKRDLAKTEASTWEADFLIMQELQIFNEASAGIFSYLKERELLDSETFSLRGIRGGEFIFEKPTFDLSVPRSAVADFSLCSEFDVKSLRLINRHSGLGLPLVADVIPKSLSTALLTPRGMTIPVTLFFRVKMHSETRFSLSPYYQDTTICEVVQSKEEDNTGLMRWPLARDYSTPLACFMNNLTQRNLLAGMLNSFKYAEKAGLFMVEPYHPDKIPVIFIHGLMSSPETWGQMINSLKYSQEVRKNYQFWFYSYSTGAPIIYSAGKLREALQIVRRECCTTPEAAAKFNRMILVGHSMGGLIARLLMLKNSFSAIESMLKISWTELKKKIRPEDFEVIEKLFPAEPVSFVKRLVFMAVPHQGSAIAQRQIAKLGIRLIKMPAEIMKNLESFRRIFEVIFPNKKISSREDSMITGIDNLNPKSIFVKWAGKAELKSGIPCHSIIGNRKHANTPGGSDGIVTYTSSHLNGVASECIVKSDHSVHRNPEAIRELLRILLLHLQQDEPQAKDAGTANDKEK